MRASSVFEIQFMVLLFDREASQPEKVTSASGSFRKVLQGF